jgi:ADP-ribose pyrophosphatase YjhB (NUDIX family)
MKNTCGAIIYDDDRFLFVQEAKNNKGKWNLPGGYVEENETPKTAILREVKEELSLDIEITKEPIIYQDENTKIHIFYAKILGGKVSLQEEEILNAKWFSKDEFDNIPDNLLRRNLLRKIIKDFNNRN